MKQGKVRGFLEVVAALYDVVERVNEYECSAIGEFPQSQKLYLVRTYRFLVLLVAEHSNHDRLGKMLIVKDKVPFMPASAYSEKPQVHRMPRES